MIPKEPKVAVVVTFCKTPLNAQKAWFYSISKQVYQNFEVYAFFDNNTPINTNVFPTGSGLISSSEQRGAGYGRNRLLEAVAESDCDAFVFSDHDDCWSSHFLSVLVKEGQGRHWARNRHIKFVNCKKFKKWSYRHFDIMTNPQHVQTEPNTWCLNGVGTSSFGTLGNVIMSTEVLKQGIDCSKVEETNDKLMGEDLYLSALFAKWHIDNNVRGVSFFNKEGYEVYFYWTDIKGSWKAYRYKEHKDLYKDVKKDFNEYGLDFEPKLGLSRVEYKGAKNEETNRSP